jgi:hypothetical protein
MMEMRGEMLPIISARLLFQARDVDSTPDRGDNKSIPGNSSFQSIARELLKRNRTRFLKEV